MIVICPFCKGEMVSDIPLADGQRIACPYCDGKFIYEKRTAVQNKREDRDGFGNQFRQKNPRESPPSPDVKSKSLVMGILVCVSLLLITLAIMCGSPTNLGTNNDQENVSLKNTNHEKPVSKEKETRTSVEKSVEDLEAEYSHYQKVFEDRFSKSGYSAFQYDRGDGSFVISVCSTLGAGEGFMCEGLNGDFTYPAWIPKGDAEYIWTALRWLHNFRKFIDGEKRKKHENKSDTSVQ